jgi:uncharacterized protein
LVKHVLFDASALFKRYSGEEGAERVHAVYGASDRVSVAAHCKTELASALTRQWREQLFSDAEYRRVLANIHSDFAGVDLVPLDSEVEFNAIAAMRMAPLRGMDALHIASAQVARADLFVTADKRQAEAARAVGLNTELIEA